MLFLLKSLLLQVKVFIGLLNKTVTENGVNSLWYIIV